MGIKFLCPNGHKLHVKGFLGGKKAICPKCGAQVVVPESAEQATPKADVEPDSFDDLFEGRTPTLGRSKSRRSSSPPPLPPPAPANGLVAAATASAALTTTAASVDPIDGDPEALWYVRPATGGQFGPASGEVMRAWLGEGRVGTNSLVWCEGWPDWRSASATFPQLAFVAPVVPLEPPAVIAPAASAMAVAPQVALPVGQLVQSVAVAPVTSAELAADPVTARLRKRRRNNDLNVIVSAVLALVSLLLVVVLVIVWQRQAGATQEAGGEAAQPAPAISKS